MPETVTAHRQAEVPRDTAASVPSAPEIDLTCRVGFRISDHTFMNQEVRTDGRTHGNC